MNRDQEQDHLAQADWHMAELKARIVRQRLILGRTLAADRRLLVAKSMLQALEESLRIFGKHCEQILDQLERARPSRGSAPDPPASHGRAGVGHDGGRAAGHDQDDPSKNPEPHVAG
jgi:hypothetical protein